MKKTLTIPFKEEGKYEIISFLSKILTYDAQIAGSSISKIIEDHGDGSPRPFRLVILKDNSQWVVGNKGIERIIGAKYLDMQLKKLTTLNFKWTAVATKYYYKLPIDKLVNLSELNRAVMPLSEYSGSKKPEMTLEIESDKKAISKATGFEDFVFNANLREQPDESITIIDTEKASFKDHEVDVFSLLSSEKEYKFSLEQIQIFAELNDIFESNAVIIIGEFLGYDFA